MLALFVCRRFMADFFFFFFFNGTRGRSTLLRNYRGFEYDVAHQTERVSVTADYVCSPALLCFRLRDMFMEHGLDLEYM